jgi:hypothetical protein
VIDRDALPRDATLMGLHIAADGAAMQQRLQPHFNHGVELLQVKVGRLAYKPRRSARIAYRLKLFDREHGRVVHHVVHGRMESRDEAARLHKKMRKRDWAQPAHGPALLYFDDIGLVLWGFPNDPKLEGMQHIASPGAFAALAARVPALAGVTTCESAMVKYVPGKRLVMKHRLQIGARRRIVYTKTWSHDRGAVIYELMRDLWQRSCRDADAFACPEPLAYLPESRTLILAALPGTAALATLHGPEAERAMLQAGRGLARLHAGSAAGLEAWTEAHEFENFLAATALLQRDDPERAPAIARLRLAAQSARARIEVLAPVPSHTAFRFSQLLDFRGRLAVVDFDGFRAAHPLCDVSSFVAHLLYMVAKDELDDAVARSAVRDFLAGYSDSAAWGIAPAALHWYTGVLLVAKHAQKCVKRVKSAGDVKVSRLLDRAAGLLEGGERLV